MGEQGHLSVAVLCFASAAEGRSSWQKGDPSGSTSPAKLRVQQAPLQKRGFEERRKQQWQRGAAC